MRDLSRYADNSDRCFVASPHIANPEINYMPPFYKWSLISSDDQIQKCQMSSENGIEHRLNEKLTNWKRCYNNPIGIRNLKNDVWFSGSQSHRRLSENAAHKEMDTTTCASELRFSCSPSVWHNAMCAVDTPIPISIVLLLLFCIGQFAIQYQFHCSNVKSSSFNRTCVFFPFVMYF